VPTCPYSMIFVLSSITSGRIPRIGGSQTSALTRAAWFQVKSRITGAPARVSIGGATILGERGFSASTKAV
jgi:hypothetical protein